MGNYAYASGAFAFLFILILLQVDPSLLYFQNDFSNSYPICLDDGSIFGKTPSYPGMPADYLSARIGGFFFIPWVAAAFLTVLAFVTWSAATQFCVGIGASRWEMAAILPSLAILLSACRYLWDPANQIAAAFACAALSLFMRIRSERRWVRLTTSIAVSATVYIISGQAFWIFVVIAFCFAWRARGGVVDAFTNAAAATATALLVGTLGYGLDAVSAFACTVPRSSLIAGAPLWATLFTYGAFLVFPALAVFGLTRSMPKQAGARASYIAFRGRALPQWLFRTLLCVGAFTLVVLIGSDNTTGKQLRIRRCAELRQWPEAIAQARRLAPGRFNELVSHDVNMALFSERRLLSEFFSFPQNHFTLMLDDPALPPAVVNRMMMGVYYDLGHLNMAEYQALETEELAGCSPPARRLLAMIYLAKGRLETARVYLHSLQGDPRYGAWARGRLALAPSDSVVALDEEVLRARSLEVINSTVLNQGSSADYLAQVLERNGKNRMAVEFLIMRALLQGDSEAPLRYLDALESCGYVRDTLPRHCEEAILLHEALSQEAPNLKGWRISNASTQRCGQFISLMAQSTSMDHAALQSLRARFGDTYWYYWLSLQNGVVAE